MMEAIRAANAPLMGEIMRHIIAPCDTLSEETRSLIGNGRSAKNGSKHG